MPRNTDYTGVILDNGFKIVRRVGFIKDYNGRNISAWEAICPLCGNLTTKPVCILRKLKSCNCLINYEYHGMRHTPEYNSWAAMVNRCTRPTAINWNIYGGRGITVCSKWRKSFKTFIKDMGRMPGEGYTIERIDTNGNYEPGNCKWLPKNLQPRSRRNSKSKNKGPKDPWQLEMNLKPK